MRFLLHVIDEASIHAKNESGEYKMDSGESEIGEQCDVSRSDCFYSVEAKEYVEAVVSVANAAQIKNSKGETISLSQAFSDTKRETENASPDDDSFTVLTDIPYLFSNNTNSELLMAMCQIKRHDDESEWIELHRVYFYVVQHEKVIQIIDKETSNV